MMGLSPYGRFRSEIPNRHSRAIVIEMASCPKPAQSTTCVRRGDCCVTTSENQNVAFVIAHFIYLYSLHPPKPHGFVIRS